MQLTRALADWTTARKPRPAGEVAHPEEFRRGLRLALRPYADQLLAEGLKLGLTPGEILAAARAHLTDEYQARGWG